MPYMYHKPYTWPMKHNGPQFPTRKISYITIKKLRINEKCYTHKNKYKDQRIVREKKFTYKLERIKNTKRIILTLCKNISIICTTVNLSRHFCSANNNCSTIIKYQCRNFFCTIHKINVSISCVQVSAFCIKCRNFP